MILTRRKLIGGLGLLVAAPAIVRAESLMKVRAYPETIEVPFVTSQRDASIWLVQWGPAEYYQWPPAFDITPTAAGESAA